MISVTTGLRNSTTYNLKRQSDAAFTAEVDWDRSPGVNSGGYSLEFKPEQLEVTPLGRRDEGWDVLIAPSEAPNSVFVQARTALGFRGSGGQDNMLRQIEFPKPIAPEQTQKVGLQVASALIGIPFLESMLEQPVPAASAN